MHKYLTALCLSTCVHAQAQHRCNVARRVHARARRCKAFACVCPCVHAQIRHRCNVSMCVHCKALVRACMHKYGVAARIMCAQPHCSVCLRVCTLTACVCTCAGVLGRCTQPRAALMGADGSWGAPTPGSPPPSTPPAAASPPRRAWIDGSGGSPKVTPRRRQIPAPLRRWGGGGPCCHPLPPPPGHLPIWGDVRDTQPPSWPCSCPSGLHVGTEKLQGANRGRVLLARPGRIGVPWLGRGGTHTQPAGAPVWLLVGYVLAFLPTP